MRHDNATVPTYLLRETTNNREWGIRGRTERFEFMDHLNNNVFMSILHTSGNVGIGTTSPTQKLHVAGNMRLTGALYDKDNSVGSAGQILTTNGSATYWSAAGSGTISGSGTDNYIPRFNGASAVQNSSIYADDNGNVGIGVTTPYLSLIHI